MTLVVALKYDKGVVTACDSRVTYGPAPLMREEPRKIESIGTNVGMMGTGMVGAVDSVTEELKSAFPASAPLKIKDVVAKSEDIVWSFYKRHRERFEEEEEADFPDLVLVTFDKIYHIYENGYAEEEKHYCCIGSGRPYGEYIMSQKFRPNMNEKEARELAAYTILQTSRIDPNVGGKICIAVADSDGFRSVGNKELDEILDTLTEIAIAPERQKQKIVGEIVEKRRWINAVFDQKFGFELFKQNEFAVSDIQKGCRDEADFTNRITALALLIEGIRASNFKKLLSTRPTGSINILETFLKEKYPNFNQKIITNLREIMTLRSKKMPIHKNDPKIIQVILKWEYKIPPNWSSLWTQALIKYQESLNELAKILSPKD